MTSFAVIIPVHNGEKFIENSIESVLCQSVLPDEIILVDDGSTDSTLPIMKNFSYKYSQVKVISTENSGVSSARNTGARIAKAEFILFLDADDRWHQNKLLQHQNHISKHPECDFSFSLSQTQHYSTKEILRADSIQYTDPSLLNVLTHNFQILGSSSSVCISRNLFHELGGFDLSLSRGEDWEFWVRCTERKAPCQIDMVLVTVSLRENSVEQTNLKELDNFYSTSLHFKVWANYMDILDTTSFKVAAIRILVADILKNKFYILRHFRKYENFLNEKGSDVLPLIGIKAKRFSSLNLIYKYLVNRYIRG